MHKQFNSTEDGLDSAPNYIAVQAIGLQYAKEMPFHASTRSDGGRYQPKEDTIPSKELSEKIEENCRAIDSSKKARASTSAQTSTDAKHIHSNYNNNKPQPQTPLPTVHVLGHRKKQKRRDTVPPMSRSFPTDGRRPRHRKPNDSESSSNSEHSNELAVLKNMNEFISREVTGLKKLLAESEAERCKLANENLAARLQAEHDKKVADEKIHNLSQQIEKREVLIDDFCKDTARLTAERKQARHEARDSKQKVNYIQIKFDQIVADTAIFIHNLTEQLENTEARLEKVTNEYNKMKKRIHAQPSPSFSAVEAIEKIPAHICSRRSLDDENRYERRSGKIHELDYEDEEKNIKAITDDLNSLTCDSDQDTSEASQATSITSSNSARSLVVGEQQKAGSDVAQPDSDFIASSPSTPTDIDHVQYLERHLRRIKPRRHRTLEGCKQKRKDTPPTFIGKEIEIPADFCDRSWRRSVHKDRQTDRERAALPST